MAHNFFWKSESKYEFRIEDFQNAHERALKFIVIGHWLELVSYAKHYLEPADAEDTVQEIFNVVWQKRYEFSDYQAIRKFMYVAIRNRAIDKAEAKKRNSVRLMRYKSEIQDDIYEDEIQADIAEIAKARALKIMLALSEEVLSPKVREVIMWTIDGLKDKDIHRQNVSKYRITGIEVLRKHFPRDLLPLLL
jgi:DNA-directed RNA polymerase specialized sigma24 family protein